MYMKKCVSVLLVFAMLCSVFSVTGFAEEIQTFKEDKAYIVLDYSSFAEKGAWVVPDESSESYVGKFFKGVQSGDEDFKNPATRKVVIPQDGQYYIWALSKEYDTYVGARYFDIKIGSSPAQRLGTHGIKGWAWQQSSAVPLFSGEYDLSVADSSSSYSRFAMIVVTNDADFVPQNDAEGYKALTSRLYKDGMYTANEKSTTPDKDRPSSEIAVKLNGKYMTFDVDPILMNDRTMVPFRAIFEALGCTVDWNDDTQTAKGTRNGMVIRLPIGSKNAKVNGKSVTLDQPAELVNDRTLVPLRFVSESLGAAVDWNDATQTVTIIASIPDAIYWLRPTTFGELGTWSLKPDVGAFEDTILQGINPSEGGATAADAHPELSSNAKAQLNVAQEGEYYMWVRSKDYAENQPGSRSFHVAVNGTKIEQKFGAHGESGYKWAKAPVKVKLNKGTNDVELLDTSGFYARFDSIVFCESEDFIPSEGYTGMLAMAAPLSANADDVGTFPKYATENGKSLESVAIENDDVKVVFHKVATSHGQVVQNEIYAKYNGNWIKTKDRDEALGFFVAQADSASVKRASDLASYNVTYQKDGKEMSYLGQNPYGAGYGMWFVPTDYVAEGNKVTLIFPDGEKAKLTASWTIDNEKAPLVSATATGISDGYYSIIGWEGGNFQEEEFTDAVAPYRVLKKRVYADVCTLIEQYLFTPMGCYTLTENNKYGNVAITKGVVAEPSWIPARWVHETNSMLGINMRNEEGDCESSISAPLMGSAESKISANESVNLQYRVISSVSDWFSNYKYVVQELFDVTDYRQNTYYSLNEAIFNTRNLMLDDKYAGWDENSKGHYNIEGIDLVSEANPMQALQDYLLSGDEEMLERRAIPTLAAFLTRRSLHFSPGQIGYGSHTGWVKSEKEPDAIGTPKNGYNANVTVGLYEMTGGNVPFLYELGINKGKGNVANEYGDIAPFANNLNMYIITGEQSYLDNAVKQADAYLSDVVYSEEGIMGKMPGWINFIYNGGYYPNFSSLLDIYEITKDQKYLDAAEYVAEMILTSLWVPGIQGERKDEIITVNDFNNYWFRDIKGEDYEFGGGMHWYGEDVLRVGYDKDTDPNGLKSKAATQPEQVERWVADRVGLGLEQSSTFENGSCNIVMNYWAGDFMRLAQYTGEDMFSNAGRNAIIGRFGTYSGYYQTDYSTFQQKAEYPYTGPDVTGLYFHHIPPFLAMLEDFLFGQTQSWSENNIVFPSIRQQGYAYFSSRQFGHKAGKFYDETDMWPYLAENTIDSGNLQIDWLAARKDGMLGVAFMNECDETVTTTVSLLEDIPGGTTYTGKATLYEANGEKSEIEVANGKFELTIPAKSLKAVTIALPDIKAPAHSKNEYTLGGKYELGATVTNHTDGKGYVLQITPDNYYAYVYTTAVPSDAKGLKMTYTAGNKTETLTTTEYPYEFIVKVDDPDAEFKYTVTLMNTDGTETDLGTCTLMTKAHSEKVGAKYDGNVPASKPAVSKVKVDYSGSKTKFTPFGLRYVRQGTSDGLFRFVVKRNTITAVSLTEKELKGLQVGGSVTNNGTAKYFITPIVGFEDKGGDEVVIILAEAPGVTTSSYSNSDAGNYKFNLKVYPYGTDVLAALEEKMASAGGANIKYEGSGKNSKPVYMDYERQGEKEGNFRFIVPSTSLSSLDTSAKEMVGMIVSGAVHNKGVVKEFKSVISGIESRDGSYVITVPETDDVTATDYHDSNAGNYKFDLTIYPANTKPEDMVYVQKIEIKEEDTSVNYQGSGTKFTPFEVVYSRQGHNGDKSLRFIVEKKTIKGVDATAKELVGLTVKGTASLDGKELAFESVIDKVEDRGDSVVLQILATDTVTIKDFYDSEAQPTSKFNIEVYPYEK